MSESESASSKKELKHNLRLIAVTILLLLGVTLVSTYLIGKAESF